MKQQPAIVVCIVLILTIGLFVERAPAARATAPLANDLLINELDYDQPSTDTAEFIELFNDSTGSINLANYTLELVNGTGGGATVYQTIDLPNVDLAAGAYYVVCGNAANTTNCDLDVAPDTNLVQNGAPDAVALRLGSVLVDAVSYEGDTGAPYTEGSGAGLVDNPNQADHGLSRCPNGADTAVNNIDFSFHPITPGAENSCAGNGGDEFGVCGDPATLIHAIQGNGTTSPEVGNIHVIEGVVVGDFQDTATALSGFFLQEEDPDADADPMTSEGIFVFDNGFGVEVTAGEVVRVQGAVAEFFGLTELTTIINLAGCPPGGEATAATVTLPVSDLAEWERYEGMLVTIPQTLYATDTFNQGRFGEVALSVTDRLFNPTNVTEPGTAALALQELNDRSRLLLDDGSNLQNPLPLPPYLGLNNTLRAGDTTPNLTGTLSFGFSSYRLHPTEPVSFTRVNVRDVTPPTVGGSLKVASFNVLNYFNGDGLGGGFPTARGADTLAEFNRQRDKIIAALVKMDADIIGLMELENDAPPNSAIEDLVAGLNMAAGTGTYDFVNTGIIGSDEIRVGIIYQPATVTPVGAFQSLDSSVDARFIDTKNRPVLAQTFKQQATGERLTVAVNHLKSKGSACDDVGDPDMGDGQGNCNGVRTAAAEALVDWLATDPTDSADPDYLIIGDLNAYALEDPITTIEAAGYTNLIKTFAGLEAYSYVFLGQAGYLDHALASSRLAGQVTGAAEWHINADEPRALDYNDFNQPALYTPDPYRSSDHDPTLIGLTLAPNLAITKSVTPETVTRQGAVTYTLTLGNSGSDADGVLVTDTLPLSTTFARWVEQPSGGTAIFGPPEQVVWNGLVAAGETITFTFVVSHTGDDGDQVTNTAEYSHSSGSGSSQATFTVASALYLPLVVKQ